MSQLVIYIWHLVHLILIKSLNTQRVLNWLLILGLLVNKRNHGKLLSLFQEMFREEFKALEQGVALRFTSRELFLIDPWAIPNSTAMMNWLLNRVSYSKSEASQWLLRRISWSCILMMRMVWCSLEMIHDGKFVALKWSLRYSHWRLWLSTFAWDCPTRWLF